MNQNLNYISEFLMTQLRPEDLKEGDRVQVTFEGVIDSDGDILICDGYPSNFIDKEVFENLTITRLPPKAKRLEVGDKVTWGTGSLEFEVKGISGRKVWINNGAWDDRVLIPSDHDGFRLVDGTPITVDGE